MARSVASHVGLLIIQVPQLTSSFFNKSEKNHRFSQHLALGWTLSKHLLVSE